MSLSEEALKIIRGKAEQEGGDAKDEEGGGADDEEGRRPEAVEAPGSAVTSAPPFGGTKARST